MDINTKVVLSEEELNLLNEATNLINQIGEALPESDMTHKAVEDTMDSLHNLLANCYLTLQNGNISSRPVSEYMWDDCDDESEDDDSDEDETNTDEADDGPCTIEIENPQDIPDDVWDKLFEILYPNK